MIGNGQPRRRHTVGAGLAIAALLAGCVRTRALPINADAERSPVAPPRLLVAQQASGGRVAFLSNRGGDFGLYTIDAGGGQAVQVVDASGDVADARWSANGQHLVFGVKDRRDGETKFTLFVLGAGQSEPRPLATWAAPWQMAPTWSPGSEQVAFMAATMARSDVVVVDLATGAATSVSGDPPCWAMQPAWSPDGTAIAFASNRTGSFEIYSVAPDGQGLRQLTAFGLTSEQPAWSPDGERIAYVAETGTGRDIILIDADGSHPRNLTRGMAQDCGEIAWSPDGSEIAFSAYADGTYSVWLVNTNYGPLRHLVDQGSVWQVQPAWSADGSHIAFAGLDGDNWDIYVVAADGTGLRRLTNDSASDLAPAWMPWP